MVQSLKLSKIREYSINIHTVQEHLRVELDRNRQASMSSITASDQVSQSGSRDNPPFPEHQLILEESSYLLPVDVRSAEKGFGSFERIQQGWLATCYLKDTCFGCGWNVNAVVQTAF
jgi:hypothetical protein